MKIFDKLRRRLSSKTSTASSRSSSPCRTIVIQQNCNGIEEPFQSNKDRIYHVELEIDPNEACAAGFTQCYPQETESAPDLNNAFIDTSNSTTNRCRSPINRRQTPANLCQDNPCIDDEDKLAESTPLPEEKDHNVGQDTYPKAESPREIPADGIEYVTKYQDAVTMVPYKVQVPDDKTIYVKERVPTKEYIYRTVDMPCKKNIMVQQTVPYEKTVMQPTQEQAFRMETRVKDVHAMKTVLVKKQVPVIRKEYVNVKVPYMKTVQKPVKVMSTRTVNKMVQVDDTKRVRQRTCVDTTKEVTVPKVIKQMKLVTKYKKLFFKKPYIAKVSRNAGRNDGRHAGLDGMCIPGMNMHDMNIHNRLPSGAIPIDGASPSMAIGNGTITGNGLVNGMVPAIGNIPILENGGNCGMSGAMFQQAIGHLPYDMAASVQPKNECNMFGNTQRHISLGETVIAECAMPGMESHMGQGVTQGIPQLNQNICNMTSPGRIPQPTNMVNFQQPQGYMGNSQNVGMPVGQANYGCNLTDIAGVPIGEGQLPDNEQVVSEHTYNTMLQNAYSGQVPSQPVVTENPVSTGIIEQSKACDVMPTTNFNTYQSPTNGVESLQISHTGGNTASVPTCGLSRPTNMTLPSSHPDAVDAQKVDLPIYDETPHGEMYDFTIQK